jgi:hypothetical protein
VAYERRFHLYYGVSALAEAELGPVRDGLLGAGGVLHPAGGLRITLAPAAEHSVAGWAFLFRVGLAYDLVGLAPGWRLAPALALDFVRGQRIAVLGASVSRRF